jgi:hypothetical protein
VDSHLETARRLWKLLDQHMIPDRCPLSTDSYRDLEEASLRQGPQAPRYAMRKTYPHWFVCRLCGKTFSTRYYLDRHQHIHHSDVSKNNETCWAHVVCSAVGGCEDVAWRLEPSYGRGSGPQGPDAVTLQRAWAAQRQPCHDRHIQDEMKPNCVRLFQSCFEIPQILIQEVCEPLSCRELLHRSERWKRHGVEWEEPHGWTRGGIMFVVLLMLYYLCYYTCFREVGTSNQRLLLLQNQAPGRWWRRKKRKVKTL